MTIDRVNISNQGIDRTQAAPQNELVRHAGQDRQVPSGSDSIAVSSTAKELDRFANVIDQARTERFNEVRLALEAGSYQVSAEDLARKLIDSNRK